MYDKHRMVSVGEFCRASHRSGSSSFYQEEASPSRAGIQEAIEGRGGKVIKYGRCAVVHLYDYHAGLVSVAGSGLKG